MPSSETWRSPRPLAAYLTARGRAVALGLCLLLTADTARAQADAFATGDGHDGHLVVNTSDTVVNAYAELWGDAIPGDLTVEVSGHATFAPGDLAMLWQHGATLEANVSSADTSVLYVADPDVGSWELARVVGVEPFQLKFAWPISGNYDADYSQVVRVQELTQLTVNQGASVVPSPFDGKKGGIVALLVDGPALVYGEISASGQGGRGGTFAPISEVSCSAIGSAGEGLECRGSEYQDGTTASALNGGGGGSCNRGGGGGGGHAGKGGEGGYSGFDLIGAEGFPGEGGFGLDYDAPERLLMGGGGGAGHGIPGDVDGSGAAGGGVVLLRARAVQGSGSIRSDGIDARDVVGPGGGGGGAGGALLLQGVDDVCVDVSATGGDGSTASEDDQGGSSEQPDPGDGEPPLPPSDPDPGEDPMGEDPMGEDPMGEDPMDDGTGSPSGPAGPGSGGGGGGGVIHVSGATTGCITGQPVVGGLGTIDESNLASPDPWGSREGLEGKLEQRSLEPFPLDSDGDGLLNLYEGGRDTDRDGLPDYLDPDDDNDGVPTAEENADPDGDGNPVQLEQSDGEAPLENLDASGSLPSLDSDADGTPDYLDEDDDNDGIPTRYEFELEDTDDDGLPDHVDTDDDGDGILTADEAADPDGDGDPSDARSTQGPFPDYLNNDDDGDLIPTFYERPDSVDRDTDGDGLPDHLDSDDDNDGLPTRSEAQNGEGLVSNYFDTDEDGIPDQLDDDDDGDGIPTKRELEDGLMFGDLDPDGDGLINPLDTDSDGDRASDSEEFTIEPNRIDGITPAYIDASRVPGDQDQDKIPDAAECPDPDSCPDTDGDGIADLEDPDDDGDGLLTIDERGGNDVDSDGDGKPDHLDIDDDGDGLDTPLELDQDGKPRDTDMDGVHDHLDTDDDNDGIDTILEINADGTPRDTDMDGAYDHLDTDSDGDGRSDFLERTRDEDGDGIPDYLDGEMPDAGAPDAGGVDETEMSTTKPTRGSCSLVSGPAPDGHGATWLLALGGGLVIMRRVRRMRRADGAAHAPRQP